ncbi:hypothetical protein AB0M95_41040, partial [Sphaerisporangium sp. NPDC051017]|uniref:hypothetical protein n=1 Tax=Sphaerisporangium sp. NPDC051017 TaxID=3154636 RepID=UPI00342328DE
AQSSTLITLQSELKGVSFRPSPQGQFSPVVDKSVRPAVLLPDPNLWHQLVLTGRRAEYSGFDETVDQVLDTRLVGSIQSFPEIGDQLLFTCRLVQRSKD